MTKSSKVKAQEYIDPVEAEAAAVGNTAEVQDTNKVDQESRKAAQEAAKADAKAKRDAAKKVRKEGKFKVGEPAPCDLYVDTESGEVTEEPPVTGTLVVAEGAAVTPAVMEQIKGE